MSDGRCVPSAGRQGCQRLRYRTGPGRFPGGWKRRRKGVCLRPGSRRRSRVGICAVSINEDATGVQLTVDRVHVQVMALQESAPRGPG